MEGQTHLTLGKKEERERGKEKRKKKEEEEQQQQKKTTYSLPSLRERSETPGALDRHVHWESQETPVAQSHLSASVRITGFWHSGCRLWSSRIDSVRGGRTHDSITGEAAFRSQSAAISTSRQNCVQIRYSNPGWLACASGLTRPTDDMIKHNSLNTSASYR